ncbi:hypothetical protein OH809_17135 [Streptomyces sp. NBC_00873]|nr:hypothetical protein OH809_17135 [Streptomyces sp. NBC_00873]WTA45742.1 hypothetical protein OH821_26550 [Streptomyces sp. NBC_00842]
MSSSRNITSARRGYEIADHFRARGVHLARLAPLTVMRRPTG